ncbi:AAA family ATPase [Algoriphagus aquimarinus]|uniref:ATPase family associated with various cellular activities (AAA) n=1 Tax=Algoriphagus aquimarinus TaxID=237018 RepID=A0A1I1BV24_9BACT|nr:ATP-binding protein [Algoriphagus aquimarinus]SFB54121.1 ATPase family associated with various cellular activities (AAA) [Algoriphagus aquimarinus]
MARADLLLKLVKAGSVGDKNLFTKVVESLIAEERNKQHHIVADQLADILKNQQFSKDQSSKVVPKTLLDEKLESFLFRIYPGKSLDDIVLKRENRGIIDEMVQEHHRSDLLRSYNLEPRNRVLLAGAPGNGKTSLAEGIAQSLMVPFYVIRYDGIIGSYLGETASRLKAMFDFIRTQECVLFFDEFDAIGKERGDTHETGEIKRVVSSLLLQIDRLPSYVVVVAATNHPELLDRAVWRRFQIRMELEKPDRLMIENWLKKFESRVKYSLEHSHKNISGKLEGLSFSEIEEFVLDIQRKYILSLPEVDVKKIVDESLNQISNKYQLRNG